ncbi:MAG TPA: SBBP repeat-containing protein [Pyrinomonadaceae bacterium]|nr:SBBP repeat-containing protein [Pyrinomonadaceae bacterium]
MAALLGVGTAVGILSAAGLAFYFSTAVHAAKAAAPKRATKIAASALSLPLFFEPNQGQTAPEVKFLAHGTDYGLFLTADEAVLKLHRPQASSQLTSQLTSQHISHLAIENAKRDSGSVIRMRLEGATSTAQVSGDALLPGKSDYFIGNDPSKWHQGVPQFARVQYRAVYPGVDLIYYGNQGQLEYDFRVAPGADPRQITLSFKGATAHVDSKGISGSGGDLILSTHDGEVRFQAPSIYQRSDSSGSDKKEIAGSFRQLAGNKIGFTIGSYDHSRELVIDPTLNYSTYLGGSGTESNVKIAVDSAGTIYVGGSTDSTDFPRVPNPGTSSLTGTVNIFISKINPASPGGTASLIYSAYFGGAGAGSDTLAGIAVDQSASIYIAGSTTSQNFPTTSNAFQQHLTGFPATQHGFLSKISLGLNSVYAPAYSSYLAGNGTDTVTGLAIDTNQNAYVTGTTSSTNAASNADGFPANPNGFQTVSNYPAPVTGDLQFFASKINTNGSGQLSMLYSTYFGGGYPAGASVAGGGIAVDTAGNAVNMYITGTTNMPSGTGPNGEPGFPLFNAQQTCLNQPGTGTCATTTNTDAFIAKINPNQPGSKPIYSTYLGGSGNDTGTAVAADSSGNAYVTGSTNSTNWVCTSCVSGFQLTYGGGATDAFIAKTGNIVGTVYPLNYFTYIGGAGDDIGQAIVVDSVQAAHIAGSTTSTAPGFPVTINAIQANNAGGQDAFAASISTTLSGATAAGDLVTFLGGSATDQGTGVAIDVFGNTYVAGTTDSANFPTKNPYQLALNGPADAFVSQIVSVSNLTVAPTTTSPTPNPVAAGTQVAFTFSITNSSTDVADLVVFNALNLPTSGLASTPTAKVTSGSGSCETVQGSTISCEIPTLAVGAVATVEVDMTPAVPVVNKTITISGNASANGGPFSAAVQQPVVNVVDFTISASPTAQTINAGDTATFQVIFSPTSTGYNATITPSETTSPSMVTATAPVFNPTTVTLSGSGQATTTLSIPTVARPVSTGTLFRHGSFYATWLPIGGLSLATLGIGLGRKRRRWLIGAILCLIAGAVVLQSACGKSSSTNTTTGGTQAGTYIITINGTAGSSASHTFQVQLTVN